VLARRAPAEPLLREVGQSVERSDGVAKVTGRAQYLDDLVIPGVVYAAPVRSPYAHARIIAVERATAAGVAGVLAVLAAGDLGPLGARPFGTFLKDQRVLGRDKARYEGEPVAVVVAEDRASAVRAARLVDVQYEALAPVVDVERALLPDAPLVHETAPPLGRQGRWHTVPGTNVCARVAIEAGDTAQGFREADVVLERTYTFPPVFHYTMEPHGAVASATRAEVTVWTNTGHPYQLRQELADMFELDLARIRVVVPYVGGSFGGKSFPKLEPLAAVVSAVVGRPVKIVNGVEGSMRTNRRHGARVTVKIGARRDGTLTAKHARAVLDGGAYADLGPVVAEKTSVRLLGPYRVPHYVIEVENVYTTTTPAGAFRSIGGPQSVWATESIMDELAEALEIDPVELRLSNLVGRGERIRPGLRPMDADLGDDLRRLVKAMDDRPAPEAAGRGVGVGISNPAELPISTAIVRLHYDGSVTILCSMVEVGQGLHTALTQIVAEELGVPRSAIVVVSPDTRFGPYDWSSGASRGVTVVGTAVQRAAQDVKAQLLALAADMAGVAASDAAWHEGRVQVARLRLTPADVICGWYGRPAGEVIGRGYVRNLGPDPAFWEIGMGAVEVDVDRETGAIRLLSYTGLADVGRAINPRLCEQQDVGAVVMGLGHTLFEELVYSESGSLLSASMIEYRVPLVSDLPPRLHAVLVENGDGAGPYGAKGMGEGGNLAVAPAVANAVARATGVRLRELPLTPERVWAALQAAAGRAPA
jgi:CO/xanthine dehydrogenase Mo-binding subunit